VEKRGAFLRRSWTALLNVSLTSLTVSVKKSVLGFQRALAIRCVMPTPT